MGRAEAGTADDGIGADQLYCGDSHWDTPQKEKAVQGDFHYFDHTEFRVAGLFQIYRIYRRNAAVCTALPEYTDTGGIAAHRHIVLYIPDDVVYN